MLKVKKFIAKNLGVICLGICVFSLNSYSYLFTGEYKLPNS
ncbi:MAG: hypothetical protein ACRDDL_04945 [Sarcina sp.]